MPKAFPLEFRRDVVAVARWGEARISRVARDFGVSESCVQRWLKLADVEDGVKPGVTQADAAELREAKKRIKPARARERGPEESGGVSVAGVTPQMMFPLVIDLAADRIPIAVAWGHPRQKLLVAERVLGFSKQAFFTWRANPVSARDWDNAHLTNAATDLDHDDPGFGYRFIADEIEAEVGLKAS